MLHLWQDRPNVQLLEHSGEDVYSWDMKILCQPRHPEIMVYRRCEAYVHIYYRPSIYLSTVSHCVFPVETKYRICVISSTALFLSNSILAICLVSLLVVGSDIRLVDLRICRHREIARLRCRNFKSVHYQLAIYLARSVNRLEHTEKEVTYVVETHIGLEA